MEHLFWYMITGTCVASLLNDTSKEETTLTWLEAIYITVVWPLAMWYWYTDDG